mmetsp:Transcript_31594/g.43984  ORF Transcript_31594/g.43984 Transcript_31594/m.43984 type:complete len:298 (+) Transcript_31594:342-1235(+)
MFSQEDSLICVVWTVRSEDPCAAPASIFDVVVIKPVWGGRIASKTLSSTSTIDIKNPSPKLSSSIRWVACPFLANGIPSVIANTASANCEGRTGRGWEIPLVAFRKAQKNGLDLVTSSLVYTSFQFPFIIKFFSLTPFCSSKPSRASTTRSIFALSSTVATVPLPVKAQNFSSSASFLLTAMESTVLSFTSERARSCLCLRGGTIIILRRKFGLGFRLLTMVKRGADKVLLEGTALEPIAGSCNAERQAPPAAATAWFARKPTVKRSSVSDVMTSTERSSNYKNFSPLQYAWVVCYQ